MFGRMVSRCFALVMIGLLAVGALLPAGGGSVAAREPSEVGRASASPADMIAAVLNPQAPTALPGACTPISTLPCAIVPVTVPYVLDFGPAAAGITDTNGLGTGFTMVYSRSNTMFAPAPSDPQVPGYQPSLLTIDPLAGTLTITATKGINYTKPINPLATDGRNAQLNALGVGINAATTPLRIETTVVAPTALSSQSEQAGLIFGLDEDNYVKLVVVSTGGVNAKVQLLRERFAASTAATDEKNTGLNAINLSSSPEVHLIMDLDPVTRVISGSYAINNGPVLPVGNFTIVAGSKDLFAGVNHDANPFTPPVSFPGIFATVRNRTAAPVQQPFKFGMFAINDTTPINNLALDSSSPTYLGNTTAFTATSTGGAVLTYDWDFGDSTTATTVLSTTNHTYGTVGTYTATVTATNSIGATSVATTTVQVLNQPLGSVVISGNDTVFGQTSYFTSTVTGGTGTVTYTYDFGDGSPVIENGPNISHMYTQIGSFTTTVSATNGTSVVSDNITIDVFYPPFSGVSITPDASIVVNQTATFTASVTDGTAPFSYTWDFGDGTTVDNGNIISHIYVMTGTFNVTVLVTDTYGLTATATLPVTVKDDTTGGGGTPITGVSIQATTPVTVNTSVDFTGVITGGDAPFTYTWNFGDGTATVTTTSAMINHTFAMTGTFNVNLVVTDADGSTASASKQIKVVAEAEVPTNPITDVVLTASPTTIKAGGTVAFTATVTGGDAPLTYMWNFGDGMIQTTTGPNVSHTYPVAGNYTVTVTVTDSNGSTDTSQTTIVVDEVVVPPSGTTLYLPLVLNNATAGQ